MIRHVGTLVVLALAVFVIAQPALPVHPTLAESDSMAPTIDEGDFYLVVPADAITQGDIILFYSPREGQHTTHRVVGETDEGFVTKGDNNPSTDQAAGYPAVQEEEVVGEVVSLGGEPFVISGLGGPLKQANEHQYLILALAFGILIVSELRVLYTRSKRSTERDIVCMDDIIQPLFIGLMVLGLVLVIWGASTHTLVWVATSQVTEAHTVPVGESVSRSVDVKTYTPPFTTVIVEADGMTVQDRSVAGAKITLDGQLPAMSSTGSFQTQVRVHPYPAMLPESTIRRLHAGHPILATLGTVLPIYVIIGVLYLLVADRKAPIRAPRSRRLKMLQKRLGGD